MSLYDLQEQIQVDAAEVDLNFYKEVGSEFLQFISDEKPKRIISPTRNYYFFYQYGEENGNLFTRPLNRNLFIEDKSKFGNAFDKFVGFLPNLKEHQNGITNQPQFTDYLNSKELSKVVYTAQQAIGCIGDSYPNANKSRKRVGDLFESLIRKTIQELGLVCEDRNILIPLPGFPDQKMKYQLDLVISRDQVIITGESQLIYPSEIIGSVKTTSKDRIDKVYLDKYMLSKLLGRDIPVIAIFLHDVQRARDNRTKELTGISSTFKTGHFIGYSIVLNKLDGVYYVDPLPDMKINPLLADQIKDFQTFLVSDLWRLSKVE
jgi:hypothetical protein